MSLMPCALIASLMCKQVFSSTVLEKEDDDVCPLSSKATSCGSEEELPEYIHARRPTSRTEMKHQLVGGEGRGGNVAAFGMNGLFVRDDCIMGIRLGTHTRTNA